MASVAKRKWTHNGVEKEAWVVRYFDEKGVRRSKQFEQKKPADAFKRKVEREVEDGTHVPDAASRTFRDVAEAYLVYSDQRVRDKVIGVGHGTRETNVLRKWAVPAFGNKLVRDITVEDATAVYRAITKHLKPRTGIVYLCVLRRVEQWARARGWTKADAFGDGLRELRGIRRDEVRTFTPEQVAHLLEVAGTKTNKGQRRTAALIECFVGLAAMLGLRVGEIMGLTSDNIDLPSRRLRVAHNMTQFGELKSPKTRAGIRDLIIPERLATILEHWMTHHFRSTERGLIFPARDNDGPMKHDTVRQAWRTLLRRCDMAAVDRDHYHFHSLRHFCASWMLHNGAPIPEVSRIMGHANPAVTLQIYSHAIPRADNGRAFVNDMASRLPPHDARVTQNLISA